jgi:hypothetical protein
MYMTYNQAEWMAEYSYLLEECDDEKETLFIEALEWFYPEVEFSLFYCLLYARRITRVDNDILESYIQKVIVHNYAQFT